MPPKRGRPPKSPSTKPPPKTATKRNKRASTTTTTTSSAQKAHTLQNDAEIMRAFRLFAVSRDELDDPDMVDEDDEDEEGYIKIVDVRRCLSSINLPKPPADFFDDPDQTHISSAEFLSLAQTLRDNAADDEDSPLSEAQGSDDEPGTSDEVTHAFSLFTHGRNGDNVRITLADLKRVARELREDVDENTLKLMIEEANGELGRDSVGRGVGLHDFENVMRRAGAIR